ncbi:MAG: Rpp14/Pop5 family protein [Methanomassiliicoccales archaeon]|jgi:RNase P/RNase MRP subunit POP5
MVVKDRRGRRRYIAFRVLCESCVSNDDLFRTLGDAWDRSGTKAPKLIEFDGTLGIVRCSNLEKEKTLEILTRLDSIAQKKVKVELLRTSGTLKTLRKRYAPRNSHSDR